MIALTSLMSTISFANASLNFSAIDWSMKDRRDYIGKIENRSYETEMVLVTVNTGAVQLDASDSNCNGKVLAANNHLLCKIGSKQKLYLYNTKDSEAKGTYLIGPAIDNKTTNTLTLAKMPWTMPDGVSNFIIANRTAQSKVVLITANNYIQVLVSDKDYNDPCKDQYATKNTVLLCSLGSKDILKLNSDWGNKFGEFQIDSPQQ